MPDETPFWTWGADPLEPESTTPAPTPVPDFLTRKCARCNEPMIECECDRCNDCGEFIDECECPRCGECGNRASRCECRNNDEEDDDRETFVKFRDTTRCDRCGTDVSFCPKCNKKFKKDDPIICKPSTHYHNTKECRKKSFREMA